MTTIGYVHADVRDPAVGADLLRRNAAELDDIAAALSAWQKWLADRSEVLRDENPELGVVAAALSAGTPVPPGRLYLLAHNLRNHADALEEVA